MGRLLAVLSLVVMLVGCTTAPSGGADPYLTYLTTKRTKDSIESCVGQNCSTRYVFHDKVNRTVDGKVMQYGEPGPAAEADYLCAVYFDVTFPDLRFYGYSDAPCGEAAAAFGHERARLYYGNVTCPTGACEGILRVEIQEASGENS